MKCNFSDKNCNLYQVYLEPVLATAASHQASKSKLRTRSKWLREAAIEKLIREDYPLKTMSSKFNEFYK